jgi:hypothetical protein
MKTRVIFIVLLVVTTSLFAGKSKDMSLELTFITEDMFDDIRNLNVEILNGASLAIGSVVDSRPNKETLGKYTKDSEAGVYQSVSTTTDVRAWIENSIKRTFSSYGVELADKSSAEFILDIAVKKLFVKEVNSYQGTFAYIVKLSKADGTTLFEKLITGKDGTVGKTFKANNYNQILSASLINGVRTLLNSVDLYDAIAGKSVTYPAIPELIVTPTWQPTKEYRRIKPENIALINNKGVKLGTITDSRPKKNVIASYTEEISKTDTRIAVIETDLLPWATDRLTKEINGVGVNLGKGDAEYTLSGSLLKFFVNDRNKFNARVEILFALKNSDGQKVWEDEIKGRASIEGRAWVADSYNTVLSNAYVAAIGRLVTKRSLLKLFETGETTVKQVKTETMQTPLNWEPANDYGAVLGLESILMKDFALKINVADGRTDKKFVGSFNVDPEKGTYAKVTTDNDVAGWVQDKIGSGMREYGINVVDTGSCDLTLNANLVKFFVKEGSRYEGRVSLKCNLTKKDGTKIWSGLFSGASDTWGKTFMDYNYRQVLSDCMIDLVEKGLGTGAFRKAIVDNVQ